MSARTLRRYRYQLRFESRFDRRDRPKRLASAVFMLLLLFYFGLPAIAGGFFAAVLLIELGSSTLEQTLPEDDDRIGWPRICATIAQDMTAAAAFTVPALSLAASGRTVELVVAFLWCFAICIHVVAAHSMIALWCCLVMTPICAVLVGVTGIALLNSFAPSAGFDWVIGAAACAAFLVNAVETVIRIGGNRREYEEAREAARTRLEQLEFLSRHDGLTGLLNRAAFDAVLDDLRARREAGGRAAVLLIDLNGFKPINDTYGHATGDEVLCTVASRLRGFGAKATARLGGDEFALLLAPAPDEAAVLAEARRIADAIGAPVELRGQLLQVTASIGIAFSEPAAPPDAVCQVCARADQAMYKAKANPAAGPVLFRPEKFARRLSLEDKKELAGAIAFGAFRPHYQPKVELSSGRITGFEALARWHHPERGLLPPADFLPQITALGLQRDFTLAIAGQVLRDLQAMLDTGLDPGRVSINVPEASLAVPASADEIAGLIETYPACRRHLTFEITEDVVIARSGSAVIQAIRRFRTEGIRISLDDFGTGFASFRHLKELEFDELKIDASFVGGLGTDPVAEVIVDGFVSIGSGLGADIVAEGVETEQQAQRLRAIGCHYAQGFLFGRPEPAATATRLLEEAREGPSVRRAAT